MRRIWIGIGLLAVLLISGILMAEVLADAHVPSAEDLRQASELVLEDDWAEATTLTGQARNKWEKKWCVSASFMDHGPMDEIDAMFAELHTYEKARDNVAYSATCAHLAELMESLGKAHAFNWWNLL